jgi:hypothetical protein
VIRVSVAVDVTTVRAQPRLWGFHFCTQNCKAVATSVGNCKDP